MQVFQLLVSLCCGWLSFSFLVGTPMQSGHRRSDQESESTAVMREQIAAVMRARTGLHACFAYAALFDAKGDSDLEVIKASEYDGVALQAAWEEVARRIRNLPADRQHQPSHTELLYQFVGFVEGRLRVTVPGWWKQTLVDARLTWEGSVRISSFPISKSVSLRQRRSGFFALPDTSLEPTDRGLMLKVRNESMLVPTEVLNRMSEKLCVDPSITAAADSRSCYVAVHESVCRHYVLLCLDRKSGKPRWETRVWAGDAILAFTGIVVPGERFGCHSVTMTIQTDAIILFGADNLSAYVEGFRLEDGRNLFRFSTSFSPTAG